MLDPNEKLIFDGMVSQLCDKDPGFLRKIDRLGRPRRALRRAVAILLWTVAPVCIVLGGWTGLLMAAVAAAYGAFLVARPGGMDGEPAWSSSNRRPGAPSL